MVTPGRAILGAIMKSWKSHGHFVREKNDNWRHVWDREIQFEGQNQARPIPMEEYTFHFQSVRGDRCSNKSPTAGWSGLSSR
ncbi:hypothetical protein HZH66_007582 [Vespula vulgaris]|uniref:Uncharacterized protein n=1 Tax=Vespula vulgaris TaxID=7454 RepID=A0A834N4R0_VESVU|nr:hypothetical protein HZH66_007582 [Vespula vulgaris]